QIADALDFAHERQIIHRDVKPGNILLMDSGNSRRSFALLSDFGIARVTQAPGQASRSSSGTSGTPPYMAPEHLMGNATKLSDQYSLGMMLYESLSGEVPLWEPESSVKTWQ